MPPSRTLTNHQQAYNLAHNMQLAAGVDNRPDDPDAVAHDQFQRRLHKVSRAAPAARAAWAYLTNYQVHPVPLDGNLDPAGDPLTDAEQIIDHWTDRPGDGIGFTTGPHPSRTFTYLALKVDRFGSWTDWLTDAAKVTRKVPSFGGWANLGRGRTAEAGAPTDKTTHRDPGAFTRLLWSPPPLPSGQVYNMDSTGGELLAKMKAQQTGRGGWVWFVLDGDVDPGKGRKLTDGVQVLPAGTVIPWEGSRTADGWTLQIEAPMYTGDGLRPFRQPVPDWLTEKLTSTRSR